jgi:HEAT repeat protein
VNGNRWMAIALTLALIGLTPPATARPAKAPKWKTISDKLLDCAGARDATCIEAEEARLSALGKASDPGMRALLTSGNEIAVAAGLRVLQETGLQGTAEFAAGLLAQEDFDFKALVAEKLGMFKGRIIVDALSALAGSRRPFEREKAVEALGQVADAAGIDALVTAAKDKFFSVRIKACEAMGRFDDPRVLGALGEALATDGNSGVRVAAARALGETGSDGAVTPLIVGLEDSSFTVQSAAYDALKTITKIDLGAGPDEWRSWLKRKNK